MDFEINYEGHEDEYALNYKEIAAHTGLAPTIRMLAIDLQEKPYMSPGDWFKSLSNIAVQELVDLVEGEDPDSIEQQLLLTMMLSRAEGVVLNTQEDLGKKIGMLRMLCASVGLARKGLVRVYYENMSFGDEMMDRTVVEGL